MEHLFGLAIILANPFFFLFFGSYVIFILESQLKQKKYNKILYEQENKDYRGCAQEDCQRVSQEGFETGVF